MADIPAHANDGKAAHIIDTAVPVEPPKSTSHGTAFDVPAVSSISFEAAHTHLTAFVERLTKNAAAITTSSELRVGLSPKEVVWTRNKAKLYRYVNPNVRHKTPLLIIYALINKPYIMDLYPGNSFIEYMLEQGFDVFLLDWGTPGPEDRGLTYDDLVFDYIDRAVKHTLRASHTPELSMLGYCMGGTMTAMYAATHPQAPVRNLIFLTTPIDFDHHDIFARWLDPQHFNVDRLVETYGNIPAEIIEFGSKMLKPVANYISTYVGLWDKLDDEKSVANWQFINKWVNDGVPFPGAAFRQWITDFYQNNRLIKGELKLRDLPVDLHTITTPTLLIAAERDHISPPAQSLPLLNVISSADSESMLFPAGHVGLIIGHDARNGMWQKVARWLEKRSL